MRGRLQQVRRDEAVRKVARERLARLGHCADEGVRTRIRIRIRIRTDTAGRRWRQR